MLQSCRAADQCALFPKHCRCSWTLSPATSWGTRTHWSRWRGGPTPPPWPSGGHSPTSVRCFAAVRYMIAKTLAQRRLVCMSSVPADANVSSDSCNALHLSPCGGLTLDSRLCSWVLASSEQILSRVVSCMYAELLSLTYDVMPAEYASVIITEFGEVVFVACLLLPIPALHAWHSSVSCSMFRAATSCYLMHYWLGWSWSVCTLQARFRHPACRSSCGSTRRSRCEGLGTALHSLLTNTRVRRPRLVMSRRWAALVFKREQFRAHCNAWQWFDTELDGKVFCNLKHGC